MNNWIEDAWLDLSIHRLKHRAWISDEQVWRKWIRS